MQKEEANDQSNKELYWLKFKNEDEKLISETDSSIVFVYGDPNYYSKFGFEAESAQHYIPAYKLTYPEGWRALQLKNKSTVEHVKIKCVDALNDERLW